MTLELVVIFPVVLLLIFGAVQGAIHYHARNVAQAAAAEAVTAGSVLGGTESGAEAAAETFIASAGDGILTTAAVRVQRTGTTITATVEGRSLNIMPGIPTPAISQTVSGTVERTG